MKTKYIKFMIPVAALALTGCFSQGRRKENSKTGFVKVDNMTMVCSDLDSSYAPSKGAVKMLVVPIAFVGDTKDVDNPQDYYENWTSSKLTNLDSLYFGKENSLKAYYANASFRGIDITGKVASVYENSTISTKTILEDDSMEKLFDLIEDAVTYIQENDQSINWAEYDLNRDGCIDNIHLVTNYKSDTWNDVLWPHMYQTGRTGTLDNPMANVYSISCIDQISNASTAIHEQGHIFGLDDYYDYSDNAGTGIDYVGYLDMQSGTCFDWNSFSKLSMGWVKPYVVNGEAEVTTINIKAASLNGDCILIPADYSTWNGSAFDEYFLLELFAPYGNNREDWQYFNLGSRPGIRLYHVDARIYGGNVLSDDKLVVTNMEQQQINSKEDIANWNYISKGCNNSSDWTAYPTGIEQLADHPLLSLIQKGGRFTFSEEGGRSTLNAGDLFRVNDEFTFEKYSIFLNKDAEEQELTDKGEVFPYSITIDYIDEDDATVTFTKVK